MAIPYRRPDHWIKYDRLAIADALAQARGAILGLQATPYQKSWVEQLQAMQLKREVAGTSRIEGASFTDDELNAAVSETPEELFTRSQRQARAATKAYRWLKLVSDEWAIDRDLVARLHEIIITDADDDHCPPGVLRAVDQNVTFGNPPHRGADGGECCEQALEDLLHAVNTVYGEHDQLVQALALHYHMAAIHPFLDGNGRSARALEALLLQRAGLRDICFIPMSNFYYEEKPHYLKALAAARNQGHDITPFLIFGLHGVKVQAEQLLKFIHKEVSKALLRNMAHDLFGRLKSKKKRVIAKRQLAILNVLLDGDQEFNALWNAMTSVQGGYQSLKKPYNAFIRDLNSLLSLGAIAVTNRAEEPEGQVKLSANLDWPREITETEFFQRIKKLPQAKTYKFLQPPLLG